MSGDRVLGVDACSAGWVGIALSGNHQVRAYVDAHIEALVGQAVADGPLHVVGIDIPIGMPDASVRRADLAARAAAGPRRASVFMTPVRDTLALTDYRAACDLNMVRTGRGISRQAFNLLAKIRQVDDWLPAAPCRVIEVHPELKFAELAGAPLPARSPAGRALPSAAGCSRTPVSRCPRTWVWLAGWLAATTCWTLLRPPGQRGGRRPAKRAGLRAQPERFSDGIDCAIWT